MAEIGGSPRRGAAFKRDWTKGSIIRNLWLLSWPVMISGNLWAVTWVLEMVWMGRLGAASLAGVGIAGIVGTLVMSAKLGLTVGARAMVARFVGAGDEKGANHVARQALVISAAYGVVTAPIGFFFAEPILSLFGLEADAVAAGTAYLRMFALAWVPMSFWLMMAYSIMPASGDTVTPLRIESFIRLVQVVLAPFLVFGWWIFPHLGVGGAALSYAISEILGMAIGFWVLFTGRTRLRLTLRDFRLDPNIIWRILKIGIPASVMGVQRAFGNLMLAWFMVPFGTLAVAAHGLIQRIETIIFMPGWGLGMGAGVLVGQNLGAGQPERAERSGWLAVGLVEGFLLIASVAILVWAENIIRIFSTEPGLVELTSVFLRIAAAGYLGMALVTVLQQCISSAGDTLPPMLVSLGDVWVVRLPLAFLLPRVTNLGVYGVRWAMVAGIVMGAVIYAIYFRLGRWKHKRV